VTLIGWVDTEGIEGLWPDSVTLSDEDVAALLQSAYEQVAVYAPALPDAAAVPERYRQAQLAQARDNYAATRAGDGEVIGFNGDYAIRVRPLSTQVKQLLRPRPAVPRIG
jgi:hypothetical protein